MLEMSQEKKQKELYKIHNHMGTRYFALFMKKY